VELPAARGAEAALGARAVRLAAGLRPVAPGKG